MKLRDLKHRQMPHGDGSGDSSHGSWELEVSTASTTQPSSSFSCPSTRARLHQGWECPEEGPRGWGHLSLSSWPEYLGWGLGQAILAPPPLADCLEGPLSALPSALSCAYVWLLIECGKALQSLFCLQGPGAGEEVVGFFLEGSAYALCWPMILGEGSVNLPNAPLTLYQSLTSFDFWLLSLAPKLHAEEMEGRNAGVGRAVRDRGKEGALPPTQTSRDLVRGD